VLLHEPIEVIATFQWTLNNDVSLATIATGVTAIGALVIGALQTRRMRRTWQAQNAIDILRDMQSETQRAARHTIFGLKGDRIPYNTWTEEEKHKAGVVIQLLNTAAYLAKRRLIPRTILDDLWGDIFRGAYESAHEHVIERRELGDKGLWKEFSDVAEDLLTKAPANDFYPTGRSDPRQVPGPSVSP